MVTAREEQRLANAAERAAAGDVGLSGVLRGG